MDIKDKFCSQCATYMERHPETELWLKCPVCGFCKLVRKKDKLLMTPLTQEQAKARYGAIVDGKWQDEAKWMVVYQTPQWFIDIVTNSATQQPTKKIYMNKDITQAFGKALENLHSSGCYKELKTFDGCFQIRDIRGVPGQLSTHAYGLAIDFNAKENGLNKEPKLSKEFVECFTKEGFKWGGDFKRKDGMHFQFALW